MLAQIVGAGCVVGPLGCLGHAGGLRQLHVNDVSIGPWLAEMPGGPAAFEPSVQDGGVICRSEADFMHSFLHKGCTSCG